MSDSSDFPDLRAFMAALSERGEVVEVQAEVDPHLEIAEIHRRVIAAQGPALWFKNVRGRQHSVVTNLFGTRERVMLAFGPRPRELVAELARAPEELLPPTPARLWRKRGLIRSLTRVGFRRGVRGSVQEVREPGRAAEDLPALTCWPEDGGPFVTLPLVLTEHPESGVANLGMYRIQLFGGDEMGIHWQIGKGGGFHYDVAERRGESLPLNLIIGGPPALILSAIAPLPENVPELLLASLVGGRKIRLGRNPDGPLPLLADAEFVLVGEVPPAKRRPEGPFGDHYGYYSLRHDYPVFHCRAMHRRRDAIFPATVVGKPRQEDFYIGDFLQEMLSPLFPLVMPGVRDLWSYGETGYHGLSAAVVRQRYKREAMVSAFRILGEGQLSLTKFLLVLDSDVDLRDFRAVLTHVLERADFRSDLYLFANLAMDSLDYTGPAVNEGSKGVLLGVGDPIRELPRAFEGPAPAGCEKLEVFSPGCLVLQGASYSADRDLAARLPRDPALAAWPLLVLADDAARCARSPINFLWTTFTRFEPAADIHAAHSELIRHHPAQNPPILIDARMKPSYPAELFADPTTSEQVDRRWPELFPGGMDAGDSGRAHLD